MDRDNVFIGFVDSDKEESSDSDDGVAVRVEEEAIVHVGKRLWATKKGGFVRKR